MVFTKEQKYALAVLTLINFFNYVDRQVIFPLFNSIKLEFGVSDFQLGLLGTLFMLIHSITSLPLGIAADKFSRKLVISAGVMFWSAATFISGLSKSFAWLLSFRSLVGVGEASYAPAATAIISDMFPKNLRARVQGVFNIGMFAGGTFGVVLGGMIVYYFHSWRIAFFTVAIPGIILALLATRFREKHKQQDEQFSWKEVAALSQNKAYLWLLISGVLVTFSAGAFISWGIEFVHRVKGYNLLDAAVILGSTMLLAGILGVILGSFLADKLFKKFIWGRAGVIAFSLILSFPFTMLGVLQDKGPLFVFFFFAGTFLLCFYHGPVTAVIHDIVPRGIRASAFAFYLLVIHLLGDAISPALIGVISDYKGLQAGMELSAWLILASGLTFLPVCYYIKNRRVRPYASDETLIDV